jgi:hypothetical protein
VSVSVASAGVPRWRCRCHPLVRSGQRLARGGPRREHGHRGRGGHVTPFRQPKLADAGVARFRDRNAKESDSKWFSPVQGWGNPGSPEPRHRPAGAGKTIWEWVHDPIRQHGRAR